MQENLGRSATSGDKIKLTQNSIIMKIIFPIQKHNTYTNIKKW